MIQQNLKRFEVPGVSVAIVREGKVLLTSGFGLRNVAKKLPMTGTTVQPIASVTKSFTVSALASLVHEGKVEWDKPVRGYLPDFQLFDERTNQVTVRDLLTHRTGLPRHDSAWFGSSLTREQLFLRLRHFEPDAGLRERFQYNNSMYMTAGFLGGRLAGTSWASLLQTRRFEPLKMKTASVTLAAMRKQRDVGEAFAQDDRGMPLRI